MSLLGARPAIWHVHVLVSRFSICVSCGASNNFLFCMTRIRRMNALDYWPSGYYRVSIAGVKGYEQMVLDSRRVDLETKRVRAARGAAAPAAVALEQQPRRSKRMWRTDSRRGGSKRKKQGARAADGK